MKRFGFIMHPLSIADVCDFEPGAVGRSAPLVERVVSWMKNSFEIARVRMTTLAGEEVEAIIECVPRLPAQMAVDDDEIRALTIDAARALEAEGVSIIGLGAYSAIVASHGRLVQKAVSVPVTSGNTFTVWSAVEATKQAADLMDVELSSAKVVVIGATGSIGRAVTVLLAPLARETVMVGRSATVAQESMPPTSQGVTYSNDVVTALKGADILFSATSDVGTVVNAEDIPPGCIVCDVARPRDIGAEAEKVPGVLIIEGGIIRLPGRPSWSSPFANFNNMGLPDDVSFACFAETALRAIEPRLLARSLGIDAEDFPMLAETAARHGFHLSGLREQDRQLSPAAVSRKREERALLR